MLKLLETFLRGGIEELCRGVAIGSDSHRRSCRDKNLSERLAGGIGQRQSRFQRIEPRDGVQLQRRQQRLEIVFRENEVFRQFRGREFAPLAVDVGEERAIAPRQLFERGRRRGAEHLRDQGMELVGRDRLLGGEVEPWSENVRLSFEPDFSASRHGIVKLGFQLSLGDQVFDGLELVGGLPLRFLSEHKVIADSAASPAGNVAGSPDRSDRELGSRLAILLRVVACLGVLGLRQGRRDFGLLAAAENRIEPVVVRRRDRFQLVVVTAGTADRQAH